MIRLIHKVTSGNLLSKIMACQEFTRFFQIVKPDDIVLTNMKKFNTGFGVDLEFGHMEYDGGYEPFAIIELGVYHNRMPVDNYSVSLHGKLTATSFVQEIGANTVGNTWAEAFTEAVTEFIEVYEARIKTLVGYLDAGNPHPKYQRELEYLQRLKMGVPFYPSAQDFMN